MGHTNSTANLALPQFIGTDKPTWLSDVNGAFAAIDTYAGTNDAALAITDAKADTAVNDAASAVTTATNAANTAGTASTQATNAVTVAGNALTVANGINSKVGVLTDLHTTDKSSVVNAINELADAGYTAVATSSSTGTIADKLGELATTYAALTFEQKISAVITLNDTDFYLNNDVRGLFKSISMTASATAISSLQLNNSKAYISMNGAIPTDTVKSLFRSQGINEKFHQAKNSKKESK